MKIVITLTFILTLSLSMTTSIHAAHSDQTSSYEEKNFNQVDSKILLKHSQKESEQKIGRILKWKERFAQRMLKKQTKKKNGKDLEKRKIQPMILFGLLCLLGFIVTGILSNVIATEFFVLPFLIASIILLVIGMKKAKQEPEKWKGRKLVNIVLISIGVFLLISGIAFSIA